MHWSRRRSLLRLLSRAPVRRLRRQQRHRNRQSQILVRFSAALDQLR